VDRNVADLLGIDLDDHAEAAEVAAIERDMDLIETLVQLRRDQKLTQEQVADRMGISQPTVSDFERLGGDPHLSTIRRYAHAVGAHLVTSVVVGTRPSTHPAVNLVWAPPNIAVSVGQQQLTQAQAAPATEVSVGTSLAAFAAATQ
jgi:transcriptional regulator with XRE-family HTH domain